MNTRTCIICGYDDLRAKPYEIWPPPEGVELTPPYENQLGAPSYLVCPLCGFEFGFDDNPGTGPGTSFDEYRARWTACGRKPFANGKYLPEGHPDRTYVEDTSLKTYTGSVWKGAGPFEAVTIDAHTEDEAYELLRAAHPADVNVAIWGPQDGEAGDGSVA